MISRPRAPAVFGTQGRVYEANSSNGCPRDSADHAAAAVTTSAARQGARCCLRAFAVPHGSMVRLLATTGLDTGPLKP